MYCDSVRPPAVSMAQHFAVEPMLLIFAVQFQQIEITKTHELLFGCQAHDGIRPCR